MNKVHPGFPGCFSCCNGRSIKPCRTAVYNRERNETPEKSRQLKTLPRRFSLGGSGPKETPGTPTFEPDSTRRFSAGDPEIPGRTTCFNQTGSYFRDGPPPSLAEPTASHHTSRKSAGTVTDPDARVSEADHRQDQLPRYQLGRFPRPTANYAHRRREWVPDGGTHSTHRAWS